MCRSPDALAKLSLPDGSSRTGSRTVSPSIEAIARDGGCFDFQVGNVVILVTRRANTSVVRSDTLTGDGDVETLIVPNIDYAPYVAPHDAFTDALRKRCPAKLEEVVVRRAPLGNFVASLPTRVRDDIDAAIEAECGGAGPCSVNQRAVQLSNRHLIERWAEFTCRQP